MRVNRDDNSEKRMGILHQKISLLNNENRISRKRRDNLPPAAIFIKGTKVLVRNFLANLVKDSIISASQSKRDSISVEDVQHAMEKRGVTKCDTFPSATFYSHDENSASEENVS